MEEKKMDYKKAGVDIEAGYKSATTLATIPETTMNKGIQTFH